MNDKELLELAAKAAGIKKAGFDGKNLGWYVDGTIYNWNPLSDDGDALRLAVKLEIDVLSHESWCGANSGELDNIICEDYMDDPMSATRRAIVRAAAEIGKNL